MPIISISLNESLKKFLDKLVSRNQYENKSKLIRDALLRLMSSMDVSSTETYSEITQISKSIMGNMVIVIPTDQNILKKLNRIEIEYQDQIVSKNQRYYNDQNIIFMVFEGLLQDFQKMVVKINSIKEIKNFRYLILN